MKAEFKKGQAVNVYTGREIPAEVTFERYIVASCGPKRLHLLRDDGSNAEFRLVAPYRRDRYYSDVQCATVEPVAHAAVLRRQFAGWTRERLLLTTEAARRGLREGWKGAQQYADHIAEQMAAFEASTRDIT